MLEIFGVFCNSFVTAVAIEAVVPVISVLMGYGGSRMTLGPSTHGKDQISELRQIVGAYVPLTDTAQISRARNSVAGAFFIVFRVRLINQR